MALGEAPGAQEDLAGLPFVHVAGGWLDRMFVSMGLNRAEVFVVNSARCRPPGNRTPLPDEVDTCLHRWLRPDLEAVQPEVLFVLGSVPSLALLGAKIKDTRGRLWIVPGVEPVLFPLFHPAVHAYNEGTRPEDPTPLTRGDLARFRGWKEEVDAGRSSWVGLATIREGAPGMRPASFSLCEPLSSSAPQR
jgi:DNA polymerase